MEEPSSEEDLHYLEERLNATNKLSKETMSMLRKIVSNEFKDRKYPGRFGRGQEGSDNEGNPDDEDIDLMKLSRFNRIANKPQLTNKDFDQLKGLTGEEQLSKLSGIFNFYAMDEGLTSGGEYQTITPQ